MTNSLPETPTTPAVPSEVETPHPEKTYVRFDLSYRIEHIVFLISFTILGITGLAQKYATSIPGGLTLALAGGIENARTIHHTAVLVMMIVSVYHVLSLLYRMYVLRVSFSMFPTLDDFKHLFDDIMYYIGKRKHKAFYGRYNYAEKAEYFAVVWGTVIMGITGFMMWNPITTAQFLPGEVIPAAKAAHGAEAVLAVLAIIIWHFYHVHIRHFNKSMFTGKLTESELRHEHPAEHVAMKANQAKEKPPAAVIQRRQRYYMPVAAVLVLTFGFGIFKFFTLETTAVVAAPPAETGPIFVPFTVTPTFTATPEPTSTPTPLPTMTPQPTATLSPELATPSLGGEAAAPDLSWIDMQPIFQERCGACHNAQAVLAGLNLATYQDALKGGQNGAVIAAGDPQTSRLIQLQLAGGHPGQLTPDEIAKVSDWIKAGALETGQTSDTAPAPQAAEVNNANTWLGNVQTIFQASCATCHNPQMVLGGLDLTTLAGTIQGGQEGAVVISGDAQGSKLVQLQSAGGQPGQLTDDELAVIIAWINAGLPEK